MAFLNAVTLAIDQSKQKDRVRIQRYFFDNEPSSPIQAYNKMVQDRCSAIVGFEYLSDLLLIEKIQQDTKIPIFTSYSSSNETDHMAENIFMFMPTYDYLAKKMVGYLQHRFHDIKKVLVITEIDRPDLVKYKAAYEKLFKWKKIHYETLDFLGNDNQFENKLTKFTKNKKYDFVFVFSGAVGSTKIINEMNDHKKIFVGTENFGSSTNQSLYVRLKDKKIIAFTIRNIDFLKSSERLNKFRKEYNNKYSTMPNPLSAYTYDAMMIILKTLDKNKALTFNNIVKINYKGITGAYIKRNILHRSNQYAILSIGKKGFVCEE